MSLILILTMLQLNGSTASIKYTPNPIGVKKTLIWQDKVRHETGIVDCFNGNCNVFHIIGDFY